MATVRKVIRIPPGTKGEDVTRLLAEGGAKPGEAWTTTDSGRTWWKNKKGLGGNAEVHEGYSVSRGISKSNESKQHRRRKRMERRTVPDEHRKPGVDDF